eukprot:TRINITY_DN7850_c4_g1_i4.p1 TRINITY_DN7850_c4_g1~~TRINITY_DN7850_c4_g1_i4.p1  ORF type:complete len:264 (+),score=38.48 TRINITY_DN7850_c4_g1_i4:448-1239(+)
MCPAGHLKDVFCHSKPNDGIALTPGLAVFYTVATQKGGKTWALNVTGPAVTIPDKSAATEKTMAPPLPLGPGHRGIVKQWLDEKGYGFIQHESGKDIFCHTKGIGYGSLIEGQEVEFSVGVQQQGSQWATDCKGPGYVPQGAEKTAKAAAAAAAALLQDPYAGMPYSATYGGMYGMYGMYDPSQYAAYYASMGMQPPDMSTFAGYDPSAYYMPPADGSAGTAPEVAAPTYDYSAAPDSQSGGKGGKGAPPVSSDKYSPYPPRS